MNITYFVIIIHYREVDLMSDGQLGAGSGKPLSLSENPVGDIS